MNIQAYALLLVAIFIGVVGQLLFKYGMSRRHGFRLRDVAQLVHDFPVVGGFCCYAVSTLLYFKVLADIDLSVAYPTVSLGYILVIIMSKLLFNESVSMTRWLGVVIVCTGVVLVGLGSV